jgi:type 2 lantibiotic biosynthesis protein LanM
MWNSRGERIADVLQETGLHSVAVRLAGLSAGDRERQSLLIRASMTTLSRNVRPERPAEWSAGPRDVLAAPVAPPSDQQLIGAARLVGDRLMTLAIGDVHWIGLSLQHDRTWVLSPIGTELYAGTTGIALFLAVLGRVTGESRYRERAERVVEAVVKNGAPTTIMNIGAFSGASGRAYAFLVMGQLWNRPDLIDRAEAILVECGAKIEKDIEFDVISGTAGLLHVLCAFLEVRPSDEIRRVAERCGEYLMSRALVQASGVAWTPTQKSEGPLLGQSHGAAGISWALTRLFALTGDDRLRETALGGVAYEQSLFRTPEQNWPDLRLLDGEEAAGPEPRFGWTWCHGAPGIGLSRFAMSATLKSPELLDQAVVALHSTSRFGLGNGHGHCLCHGDLGNLEMHLGASERLGDPRWERIRRARLGGILSEIAERGYACGVPNGAETPGLLTGLAGIGYGLLRQAQPALVPSLLALEPLRFQPAS